MSEEAKPKKTEQDHRREAKRLLVRLIASLEGAGIWGDAPARMNELVHRVNAALIQADADDALEAANAYAD